ncbi:hypothetical protein KUK83_000154 [Vibrio parahaemolyticus]|nr:hypothetical protein [Vibrio parahaemolyticus]
MADTVKYFTEEEVIQRVRDGQINMTDLPSRRLNKLQVVIEVCNKKRVCILTAPLHYIEDGLIDTLLYSFTVPDYATRVSISEKTSRNNAIYDFFSFIDTQSYPNHVIDKNGRSKTLPLPTYCFKDWLDHLKATQTPYKVWHRMHYLHFILRRTLNHRYGSKISNWPQQQKETWLALDACMPSKPIHKKRPTLGLYLGIPPQVFSNQELQMGLRFGVIWLLKRLQTQRDAFSSNPVIQESLQQFQGTTVTELKKFFYDFSGSRVNRSSPEEHLLQRYKFEEVAETSWKIIQSVPLLTEWQCYCFKKLRPALIPKLGDKASPLVKDEQQLLLSRFLDDSDRLRTTPKGYGRNDHDWRVLKKWLGPAGSQNHISQPCLWGADWLLHNGLEQLLMVWLLASERAQPIGIKGLNFDSVHITRRQIQLSTVKLRRASSSSNRVKNTDVHTPIYRLNEPVGETYYSWIQQVKKAQKVVSGFNTNNKYIYGSSLCLAGTICTKVAKALTNTFLPLELLSVPGTEWNKTFIEDSGDIREAHAFIHILRTCIKKKRDHPESTIQIPIGPIGESLVLRKEMESNVDDSHSTVASETFGHSKTTARNIYKDGFSALGIDEIQVPVQAFARKVGDEKIKLAMSMAEELNQKTLSASFSDLESLCGIASACSTQKALLEKLDSESKVTITGEIALNDKLILVQTDFTAAMMWGYMKHLEKYMPELMSSVRDQTSIRYLAQYLHLTDTYKRLDSAIQEEGKRLANNLQFPFPPLN